MRMGKAERRVNKASQTSSEPKPDRPTLPPPGRGPWLSLQADHPSKRSLLSERVAQQIERLIVDQQMKPGDRLPSGRELTSRYGVSRTAVRDAVAILEQRGLVETRQGSGTFVCDGGSDAVADVLGQMLRHNAISLPELMEARGLLEIHNAATAARSAVAADLEGLVRAIADMERATGSLGFVEADLAFHEALAQAGGNRVLAAFLRSLRPLLVRGMLIGTTLSGAREAAVREHAAIFDAVRAGNAAAARRLMGGHLRRSYDEWAQAGYVDRAIRPGDDESDTTRES